MFRSLKIALPLALCAAGLDCAAQAFNEMPRSWKWRDNGHVVLDYGEGNPKSCVLDVKTLRRTASQAVHPGEQIFSLREDALNPTLSPDSSRLAYTAGGDLYLRDMATGEDRRLTFDGGGTVLNGYASWVYYEEIFGRQSAYRAFWWSPDSHRLLFYRFDESLVPVFPIYSAAGKAGALRETRYPKCGDPNPSVRIGIIDLDGAGNTVWADFSEDEDVYFGTPFWGSDGKAVFIPKEPRRQNSLELFRVDVADGGTSRIYKEDYPTWLDWPEDMLFAEKGLYMLRSFETGWQQIYYLSYDGSVLRRLTDGENWRMQLLAVDRRSGDVLFTARRDARLRSCLYRLDCKGRIHAITDPGMDVSAVELSPDLRRFVARVSNSVTPSKLILGNVGGAFKAGGCIVLADQAGPEFKACDYALPEIVSIRTPDSLELYAAIVYPKDFDPSKKYPVHVDIYGGPDTPLVRDAWRTPDSRNQWWSEHGIIQLTADCRAAGHNGRKGLDKIFGRLSEAECRDFVQWAAWLQSQAFVQADKIGVEGFSFGGTMTSLLLFDYSEYFHYGIAGGGVYDWALYDSHYTERFMDTPQANPEGYAAVRAIDRAVNYPAVTGKEGVMLKLTHGTGDDNVHFQNTLQLVDELQRHGKVFELMIYPDGMHGYKGYQGRHFEEANRIFWLKYLKDED